MSMILFKITQFRLSRVQLFIATLVCFDFVANQAADSSVETASLADSSAASFPLPLRVEPKPKSGIRQQDLLKKVVEVKPKRPKISSPSSSEPEGNQSNLQSQGQESNHEKKIEHCVSESNTAEKQNKVEKSTKSLLGLAYASSDDDDDD
ncbi:uncharacterized protein LOC128295454 [Gossypium arboreum]|uniref:uncharacterized protein LOC128295454 n=1 Tax=Gossypium arboreum TaxID=29729 RepID=UPI0022F14E53|nr:uncharacterized protein LOC128295454 [Gossypium arboreum]